MKRSVAALAALAAVLALGACGGGADGGANAGASAAATQAAEPTSSAPSNSAEAEETVEASGSPTSEPTADPSEGDPSIEGWETVVLPERGPSVDKDDLQGAIDAAAAYLASNYGGYMMGSTHNIEALADSDCDQCKQAITQINYFASRGMKLDPEFEYRIEETAARGLVDGGEYHLVLMKVADGPFRILNPDGTEFLSEPEEVRYLSVALRFTEDGWVIGGLGQFVDEEEYLEAIEVAKGDSE